MTIKYYEYVKGRSYHRRQPVLKSKFNTVKNQAFCQCCGGTIHYQTWTQCPLCKVAVHPGCMVSVYGGAEDGPWQKQFAKHTSGCTVCMGEVIDTYVAAGVS